MQNNYHGNKTFKQGQKDRSSTDPKQGIGSVGHTMVGPGGVVQVDNLSLLTTVHIMQHQVPDVKILHRLLLQQAHPELSERR